MNNRIIKYGISSLSVGLALFMTGMNSGRAHATEATLTVTLSSANVSANVAPVADATGTFTQSSPITVGVTTNNATGYNLAIKANDSTYPNRLINSSDNSYLTSISSATNLATMKATDLSSITTTGGNQGVWGYLPSKLNSVANTNFLPSPGTAGNTIDQTSSANSTAINYTIAIGAKVSPHSTNGAYTNSFAITAVANPIPYSLIYSENTVGDMPSDVLDGSSDGTTVTISSTTPTRDGYAFLGWCDQATTKSGDTDTCASGHQHQPGGTVTLDATANANNIKLYAMWGPPKTIATASTMQEVAECPSTLTTGQVYTIKDSRDNQDYKVAKLADGKCWLLDNLALDLTNSTVLSGMTQDNTNASNTTLGYLKGTTTGTTSDQYATAGVSNWTSSYSYSAPLANITNKDVIPTDSTSTAGGYKVGGYYNYCAASAGSYCYGNGTSEGKSSGNATEDICPKGWRMPGGSSTVNLTATPPTGEYQNLYNNSSYNTYAKYSSALRLPLSGDFYNGSASSQGSNGVWWSSTRNTSEYMSVLCADTNDIYPARSGDRGNGSSVRCVLGS